MTSLKEMLNGRAGIGEIAGRINSLPAEQRIAEALALGKKEQARLFELAKDGPEAALADLVPEGEEEREFIFEGRNSMPFFSRFQKRFFRGADGRVYGYNHQSMSAFTGPGYFEALEASRPGELLLDYTRLPPNAPPSWPAIRGNDGGLARLVFGGMNDYVRKAGTGVLIGWAFKAGKDLRTTFILAS